MTAEEYIVEEYKAIKQENKSLKTDRLKQEEYIEELNHMLWYVLKSAKVIENKDSALALGAYITFDTVWKDEDKADGKLFEKVVQRIKSLNKEQSDE